MKLVETTTTSEFPTELDRILFRIEDVPRLMRRIFDIALEGYELSRPQWRLVAYVLRDEGMTQTELARVLELERASVGQAIDNLERKGLIERRKAPGDRRVWRIYATEEGRRLIPELRETIDEVHEQMLAGFSDQERAHLLGFLDRIMTNLEEKD